MIRRDFFRKMIGLGAAVAVAPTLGKVAAVVPEPVAPPPAALCRRQIPHVSHVVDATLGYTEVTWTAAGNIKAGDAVCYVAGRDGVAPLIWRQEPVRYLTEAECAKMDCPFPPEKDFA